MLPLTSCRTIAPVSASLVVALAAAGLSAATPASQRAERGPFLLVALPSLGTVTWTCDARDAERYALGFRAFGEGATLRLRLRAGRKLIRAATVHPGRSVRFRFVRSRVQRLSLVQATKPGTLRAYVRVSFTRGASTPYCWRYAPPRLDVRVIPRR